MRNFQCVRMINLNNNTKTVTYRIAMTRNLKTMYIYIELKFILVKLYCSVFNLYGVSIICHGFYFFIQQQN